ncbi:MAG: DUF202 domain-containing protein [Patescibacteria group bacterium]|nr:DUF202 domain-containing protein [Patescibacteria group bacterium]
MNIHFYKGIFKNNKDIDPRVYQEFLAKELILRDYLAIERTILTNEATYLAYIRTSLTVIVIGVTLFKLTPGNISFQNIAIILIVIGILIIVIGSTRTITMSKKINKFLKKEEVIDVENLP